MADAESPMKVGWTDAEKIALLVEIAAQNGGPDWKNIRLPPGRTQKACQHIWGKMKDIAAGAPGNGGNDAAPATPTKGGKGKKATKESNAKTKATPAANKKRKLIKEDEDEDEDVPAHVKGEEDSDD